MKNSLQTYSLQLLSSVYTTYQHLIHWCQVAIQTYRDEINVVFITERKE